MLKKVQLLLVNNFYLCYISLKAKYYLSIPDNRSLILLFVEIWRFWQIHFSDRIEEPLLLDVLKMIPVGMLIQRIDGREDLWAEGTLETILGLFLLLLVRVWKKHFLVGIEEPDLLDLLDVVTISMLENNKIKMIHLLNFWINVNCKKFLNILEIFLVISE